MSGQKGGYFQPDCGSKSMILNKMYQERQLEFSEIVDQFIVQFCRVGPGLNISDKTLFPAFRAFWRALVPETQHPALLGQYRVALAERGYTSNGHKRPRWYGLTLRPLAMQSETAEERLIAP
jgi:hypothetical protein